MARDVVDDLIKGQPWLDQVADIVQPVIGNLLTAGPLPYKVKDFLNGVWQRTLAPCRPDRRAYRRVHDGPAGGRAGRARP